MHSYSVSDVNLFIKRILSAEEILYGIHIKGELSNFSRNAKSGHCFFTIKDSKSMLKCIMFRNQAEKLRFFPQNGMNVCIHGDVQVYERDGVYQVYCHTMAQDGIGESKNDLQNLKDRLEAEGLFDLERKRKLPAFPKTIGVITSKSGAALHDIIQVIERRCPLVELKFFPSLVQGEKAAQSICQAMKIAQKEHLEVLIIGRGGGSNEDLGAFNQEKVVRAVSQFPCPVISAVGHDIDYTLTDFVADMRAPTPSAAAEIAVDDISHFQKTIDNMKEMLYNYTLQRIVEEDNRIRFMHSRLKTVSPLRQLTQLEIRTKGMFKTIQLIGETELKNKEEQFSNLLDKLHSLSPTAVLKRGYSCTKKESGELIRHIGRVRIGETLTTYIPDGEIVSVVKNKRKIEKEQKVNGK